MIKNIITSVVLWTTAFSFAQQSSASPYSAFGIGEYRMKGTPEQRAMGGLGVFPDSVHLNLLNPASYSALKVTTFSVGGQSVFNEFKSNTASERAKRTSLEHLAIGIPVGKFGLILGLNPNTSVGYRIYSETTSNNLLQTGNYRGEGGSNRAFVGGAYQISPKFSVGIDAELYFGEISTSSSKYLEGVQFGTRIDNTLTMNGFSPKLGMMYQSKYKNKYKVYSSFTFTPSYTMRLTKNTLLGTVLKTSSGELFDDYIYLPEEQIDAKMPYNMTIGGGFGLSQKWAVGAELAFTDKNENLGPVSGNFTSFEGKERFRVSLGGYYTPKYNAYGRYFQRITYRAGLKYENTGLVINGKTIDDKGLSLGANFPIGNGLTDIGLALEYGIRGTKSNDLIQENYFNVVINLSIADKWFRKILYD